MDERMLKQIVENQSEKILYLGLDVVAMRTCLLNKGLISQADYDAAVKKVHSDAKQQLEQLRAQFDKGMQS
jgi:hypothetical protein